jgi:hypothetical protein
MERSDTLFFDFSHLEVKFCHLLAKKMHRRDRGDRREKHFILKNLCVLCALGGE